VLDLMVVLERYRRIRLTQRLLGFKPSNSSHAGSREMTVAAAALQLAMGSSTPKDTAAARTFIELGNSDHVISGYRSQ